MLHEGREAIMDVPGDVGVRQLLEHLPAGHLGRTDRVASFQVAPDDVRHLDVVLLDAPLPQQPRRLEPLELLVGDLVRGARGALGDGTLAGRALAGPACEPPAGPRGQDEREEPQADHQPAARDGERAPDVADVLTLVEPDAHHRDAEGVGDQLAHSAGGGHAHREARDLQLAHLERGESEHGRGGGTPIPRGRGVHDRAEHLEGRQVERVGPLDGRVGGVLDRDGQVEAPAHRGRGGVDRNAEGGGCGELLGGGRGGGADHRQRHQRDTAGGPRRTGTSFPGRHRRARPRPNRHHRDPKPRFS